MYRKQLLFMGSMALIAIPAFSAGPDHLVFSEFAHRGGEYDSSHQSSEFVEIYNPTGSTVNDLQNYYVSDWASYFTLPTATRDALLPDLGTGDYLGRFPDSTTLPSAGVAVVTANGQYFLKAYFGDSLTSFTSQPGSPQLFEMFDSDPNIPNMVNLNTEDTLDSTNLSHTDAGENQFLFYWDGASDLVKDVDMVMYGVVGANNGTSNGITVKTGLTADGPDGDTDASAYADDAGSTENLTIRYQAGNNPYQFARRSLLEVGETTTGGNGNTGHDETLENANATWGGQAETTATATPGVTPFGLSSADQAPVVYNANFSPVIPAAGETITFSAYVTDDNPVATVVVKVDTGSGYTDLPMAHSGPGDLWTVTYTAPANGTSINWLVSATDSASQTRTTADYHFFVPGYPGYNTFVISDVADGDLQFSEVLNDPIGGDNAGSSEFVEIHNTTSADIDISGYRFNKAPDDATWGQALPSGTVVPANGYVVLASSKPLFLLNYPGFDPTQVVDLDWRRSSTLANSTDRISLTHPNQIDVNGQATMPLDFFEFTTVANSGAGNTGYTLELMDESGPNDDMAAWGVSVTPGGSPGRRSTLDNPGSMAITNQSRTIQNPTPADDIIINADVAGNSPTVVLHYTTSAGLSYTATPMTVSSGNTYTINLGKLQQGTLVKYYIEATDSNGQVITSPPYAMPYTFVVDENLPTDADLVITEILADANNVSGGDENVIGSEFIEIYNMRSTPIDLSYYKMGHTLSSSPYPHVLPEGTVIPGRSFFVFAGVKPVLMTDHPELNPDLVFDAMYVSSIIANNGGTVYITHPNSIDWNELTWQGPGTPLESVAYTKTTDGWPVPGNNRSYELMDAATDNSVGSNWAVTLVAGGTPGAVNSTNSAVNDWSIY